MDLERLKELIRLVEDSKLAELEIEEEGWRVRLKKPEHPVGLAIPTDIAHGASDIRVSDRSSPGEEDATLTTIKSPMVGTFYAAPAPDEAPFVRPGDAVDENQVVCIVEAMKLKNEVSASFPAIIEEVLVQNGEPVEFEQPLFVVRPIL